MLKPLIVKAVLLAAAVTSLSALAYEASAERNDDLRKGSIIQPPK